MKKGAENCGGQQKKWLNDLNALNLKHKITARKLFDKTRKLSDKSKGTKGADHDQKSDENGIIHCRD